MRMKFDRGREWPFESLVKRKRRTRANDKRIYKNTKIFAEWIMNLLKSTAPREPEDGEKYRCQGVRLHPAHNEYLHDHIDPWVWLCYSPEDDETVGLDEVEIDHWFEKVVF